MKRIFYITLILMITHLSASQACLNGPLKRLKNGALLYLSHDSIIPRGLDVVNDAYLERVLPDIDSLYKTSGDIDYLLDKGLVLIFLRKYKEAISLYQDIERIKPNLYTTASNIGTAYELIGDNKQALVWIQKSLKLEPKSHNGSEWIHVNILKTKIEEAKFINSQILIHTDFGQDSIPVSNLTMTQLLELKNMIFFQLNERMTFVKADDKIVAQLLFDLGNLAYLTGHPKEAMIDYTLARQYGFPESLITKRWRICSLERNKKQVSLHTKEDQPFVDDKKAWKQSVIISIVAAIIFLIVVIFLVNTSRNRKK